MNDLTQKELQELKKLANENGEFGNLVQIYLEKLATEEGYYKTANNEIKKGGIDWDE